MVIKINHIMEKKKLQYFTEQGAEDVIKDYNKLIGSEFYFDDSGVKYELKDIVKQKMGCGFDVRFDHYVQGILDCSIDNFMIINNISGYDFKKYDLCSREM